MFYLSCLFFSLHSVRKIIKPMLPQRKLLSVTETLSNGTNFLWGFVVEARGDWEECP